MRRWWPRRRPPSPRSRKPALEEGFEERAVKRGLCIEGCLKLFKVQCHDTIRAGSDHSAARAHRHARDRSGGRAVVSRIAIGRGLQDAAKKYVATRILE